MIRPEESAKGNENLSTPKEAADLMVRIARCDLPVSAASCARIRAILEIPKSGAFRDPIPASVPVAWKPGGIEGAQTAWGLVNMPGGPYAIAIMINYGGDDADMERPIREISSAAYKLSTQIARTTPNGAPACRSNTSRSRPARAGPQPVASRAADCGSRTAGGETR